MSHSSRLLLTRIWLPALLAVTAISSAPALAEGSVTFRACTEDKEQFPNYVGNTVEILPVNPGLSFDLITLAANRVNMITEFVRVPWKRCLRLLEMGAVDGAFNASFKPERLAFGRYPQKDGAPDVSRRITTLSYSLYAKQDAGMIWDGKQFSDKTHTIGAPRGFSIVSDLKKLGLRVEESDSSESNLMKVLGGRIGAAALQTVTGDTILRKNPTVYPDIIKNDIPLTTKAYFVMISHQFYNASPDLAEAFWDQIGIAREKDAAALAEKYY